jgi:hypothetical protein
MTHQSGRVAHFRWEKFAESQFLALLLATGLKQSKRLDDRSLFASLGPENSYAFEHC